MKYNKLFFTFVLSCFLSIFMLTDSKAQTFAGNKTLASQADVIAFGAIFTDITGNLTISGADITDLTPLSTLTSVGGNLKLLFNSKLKNLDGLSGITSVGSGVRVQGSPTLANTYDKTVLVPLGEK